MTDSILMIPDFINVNEMKKYSKYMNLYMTENIIEDLRYLYTDSYDDFNKVLNELSIRGIGFQEKYQNNFLKGINFQLDEIIKVSTNEERIKKIDFNFFGLGNFTEDYMVEDDRFFNNIPINGLYALIPSFKRILFRAELIKLGFDLTSLKESGENNKDRNKISSYFPPSSFYDFLKYCEKKSIYYLEDLNDSTLLEYKETPQTVGKNYRLVRERYEDLFNSDEKTREVINTKITVSNNSFKNYFEKYGGDYHGFIDSYFSEGNLLKSQPYRSFLDEYESLMKNISPDYEEVLNRRKDKLTELNKHSVFKDIKNLSISNFLDSFTSLNIFDCDKRKISELSLTYLDSVIIRKIMEVIRYRDSISVTWEGIISSLNENERVTLELRARKKTLKYVGDKLGITRERVRQIESKLYKNISGKVNYIFFTDLLKLYLKEYGKVNFEFIREFGIEQEDYNIFIHLLLKTEAFYYIENQDFLMKKTKFNHYLKTVDILTSENIVIYKDMLDGFSSSEIEIIKGLLKDKGYSFYNNKYIKSRLSIIARLEYLFREIITHPVKNNEESFIMLKKLMKKHFNFDVTTGKRSFFTRVADTNNVILVDSNTFMYQELDDLDSSFLVKIKKEIDETLSIYPYADPRKIYSQNIELMKRNGVLNYRHLYSIVKYVYSEEYNVGHQNTLYIYKANSEEKSAESIFEMAFDNRQVMAFEELRKNLGWKTYKLAQLIARLEHYVMDSSKQIINITDIEKEEQYEELISEVDQELEKNYIFTEDLIFNFFEKPKVYELLNMYNLSDTQALANFIKKKFEKVRGYSNFLYIQGSDIEGVESVILEEFSGVVSKKDIGDYLLSKGYSQSTVYITLDNLANINKFIPYEKNYLKNIFKEPLAETTINTLDNMFNSVLKQKNIITDYEINRILEEINEDYYLELTPYMLIYLASEMDYKVLEAYDGSMFEIPIILSKDSSVNEYDELVYQMIVDSYDGVFSTTELISFLKTKRLMSDNATSVYLKLKSSELFEFDNFDTFKIIGGIE